MNSLERDVWDVSWTVVEMTSRRFFCSATPTIGRGSFGSSVGEEAPGRHIRASTAHPLTTRTNAPCITLDGDIPGCVRRARYLRSLPTRRTRRAHRLRRATDGGFVEAARVAGDLVSQVVQVSPRLVRGGGTPRAVRA